MAEPTSLDSGAQSQTSIRSVAIATVAAGLAFLLNFAFQIAAGRLLGPAAYSLLAVLLVGVSTVAVAFSGLQYVVARSLVASPPRGDNRNPLDGVSRSALWESFGLGLGLVLLSPLLAGLFSTGLSVIILVALSVPAAAVLAIVNGRFQGTSRVHWISVLGVLLSLAKLVLAVVALQAGFGVTSVMAAVVFSTIGIVAIAFWATRSSANVQIKAWSGSSWQAIITQVFFWLMLSLPIVVGRVVLPEEVAGNVAISMTLAQVAYFLPMILFAFIFPRFVERREVGESAARLGIRAVWMSLAISAPMVGAIALIGPSAIQLVFGEEYGQAGGVVGLLALATLPLVVVGVLIQFHLARDSWSFTIRMGCALLLGVGILIATQGSVTSFAWGAIVAAFVALVLVFPYRRLLKHQRLSRQADSQLNADG